MTDTVEHETRTRPGPTDGSTAVVSPGQPPVAAVDAGATSTAPPVEPPAQSMQTAKWGLPLAVLISGMFMSILDTSIVNIAIVSIRQDFGVTAESAQWVSTSYALTEGAVVPVSVYLGNRFGHKRLFVVSIALFTLFSALCGMSWSLESMIVFRIMQAIPGGMIPVACTTLIYRIVPRKSIGVAMGLFGLGVVVAPGVGPTLGGYFVEYLSWPWIYWVNVPVGIVATIAASVILKNEVGDRTRPFDLLGFVTIAAALATCLLAVEEGTSWGWTSYEVLGLLFFASNMFLLWIVIQRQREHPLLNLRVFANRTFVISLALIVVFMVGLSAMSFYLPQFLQSVQGLTPWQAGLAILPQALVLMVTMPVAGQLYDKIGARWPAAVGLLVGGGGLLYLSQINFDLPISQLAIGEMMVAAGIGIGMMPVMTGGLSALSPELSDSGSALNTLGQRLGQSFGLAAFSALVLVDRTQFFADRSTMIDPNGADADPAIREMAQQGAGGLTGLWQQFSGQAQAFAYGNGFLVVGVIMVAAVLVAFLLPTGRPEKGDGDRPIAH